MTRQPVGLTLSPWFAAFSERRAGLIVSGEAMWIATFSIATGGHIA
jgi:hypothetical protein